MKKKYDNKVFIIIYNMVLGLALIVYAIIKKNYIWGIIGFIVILSGFLASYFSKNFEKDKIMKGLIKRTHSYDLTLKELEGEAMAKGIKKGLKGEDNKK